MLSHHPRAARLPDATYAELVRSVFATIVPTTIMGLLFIVTARFASAGLPDTLLYITGVAGSLLSIVRVGILVAFDPRLRTLGHDADALQRIERLFAVCYLAFALVLGLFAFRVVQIGDPDIQLVIVALVVGYAAGVAAGVALRPWISISALGVSVLPLAVSSFLAGNPAHSLLGVTLCLLLLGGISSLLARYRLELEKVQMRQTFASLARQDSLTGIGNRLLLDETISALSSPPSGTSVALHYIDLDRFKPINDLYGHLVGDALLRAVAARLRSVCGKGDLAVRLGGDEFVVLQTRIAHRDEAELMARRIVRCLAEGFLIDGCDLTIGASLGYVVTPAREVGLETLLGRADAALYAAKRSGGGTALMELRA